MLIECSDKDDPRRHGYLEAAAETTPHVQVQSTMCTVVTLYHILIEGMRIALIP